MAEAVAGALLSALLDALVNRLTSPEVLNFFRDSNQSMTRLLDKLNITLWSADALLNDAENKQVKDSNIKKWVDMLNHVLSEADNVVDKINAEAMRREIKECHRSRWSVGKITKKLLPRDNNSPNAVFNKEMNKNLVNVMDMLKFLLDQKDYLGLKEGVRSKRLVLKRSPASLIGDPSDVLGRDRDREDIVKLLLLENNEGSDEKVSVVPIVGMGGVGKTTLARLVFDDNRVKDHFEHRAWVTVSDDFDVFRLAKLVFEELDGKKSEAKEEKLGDQLEAFLRGKKFLLVLDDVWNEKYKLWNAFKSYLTSGADGSKIIVTTRSGTVASMMGGAQSLPLEMLSDEDCWQVFKRHVFRSIHAGVDLEDVGKKIVEKCKGLPLAVVSLAGLLCSVSNKNEWEAVLNSDVWDLHEKGNDEIIPSLWLSYSYLPSLLKRCFAYCSIFPKDYEYDKKKIILLWMAEGLLQGENMEDVGEEYFNTLISRSLFQRSTKTESSVVMHDLVHDLATFVSGKGFCVRLGVEHSLSSLTIKTRHLLYENSFPEMWNFKGLSEAKCLRTLMSWGLVRVYHNPVNSEVVVKKFRCLRVLCLSSRQIKKVTKSIGKLKHLRYLDLSNTYIKRLPDVVCTLYNLQTLLLYRCTKLTELPANMGRLLNLQHLDLRETHSLKRMPLCNWNLKALRTLSKLVLNDKLSSSKIKELKELSQYYSDGSFEIVGLENVVNPKDVLEAEFEKKAGITEITLKWSYSRSNFKKDREVLDALKPHVSLKKLNIVEYSGKELSDWVGDGSFSDLTEVSLFDCASCCQLPPFERLQSLRKLDIRKLQSVKTIHWKAGSFSNLEFLSIVCMDELQSWSLEGVAFRCLKELWLYVCQKMEVLSCGQMNTTFPSLVKMGIDKCPKLEFTGLPLPSSLEYLCIGRDSEKLVAQRMQWGLTTSLKELRIGGCEGLIDTFPEEGLLPTALQNLTIRDAPNMKALNGKAFQHLTSLQYLRIYKCPKLECLPEQGLPASLTCLTVSRCRLLEARLRRGTGKDWNKISHIASIDVD